MKEKKTKKQPKKRKMATNIWIKAWIEVCWGLDHCLLHENIVIMAGGTLTTTAGLQSLNGLFAIYKKQGPTSADVLNKLKEVLLKGNKRGSGRYPNKK